MVEGSVPIQPLLRKLAVVLFVGGLAACRPAEAASIRVVALGDSLTAGLGLPASQSFPAKLEAALRARGHDVTIVNAGVSGDTATDGLARLDWSVGDDANAVLVELGANDALRGIDPATTRAALGEILRRLRERHLPVFIAGMLAPLNFGEDFARRFDAIYPDLAHQYGAALYPFFLDGLVSTSDITRGGAARTGFFQADGLHPNADGVDAIVERLLPVIEPWIARIEKPS
jgi:acyl-CoA thioesterase-1